jgi:hypothetical protein
MRGGIEYLSLPFLLHAMTVVWEEGGVRVTTIQVYTQHVPRLYELTSIRLHFLILLL